MLGFTFVDLISTEVHKFKLKSCLVPYHLYSKIGKNMGTPGKFICFGNNRSSVEKELSPWLFTCAVFILVHS